jgi:hypothetical protein
VWSTVSTPTRDVHFFVSRDDLAPVLAKPFEAKFANGTSVSLQPGVPVLAGKTTATVQIGLDAVPLFIPSDSLGHSYAPHQTHAPVLLMSKTAVVLGDTKWQMTTGCDDDSCPEPVVRKDKDATMVDVVLACAKLTVAVPKYRAPVHPKAQPGGAFASLTGTGDISSGFDDTNIYGGLLGNEGGGNKSYLPFGTQVTTTSGRSVGALNRDLEVASSDAKQACGEAYVSLDQGHQQSTPLYPKLRLCASSKLAKAGEAPTGWGTIGTGRYGTIGHGSGSGTGGKPPRTAAVPTVSFGQPVSHGDLDKAIIRRYIKRNIMKLQYCYEKQLLNKPNIEGTISTQFFIDPDGKVTNSDASGFDTEVASCIAEVIKNIEFPKPRGGGGVQVNYPFVFKKGDDAAPPPKH